MKQTSFFKTKEYPTEFGGALLEATRKARRPLATKKALHLVLKTETSASVGLFKSRRLIDSVIQICARKFRIKIYRQGLEYNHIHLLIKFSSIEDYKRFVRAVTGMLAKKLKLTWIYRPYSRVVEWGRAFKRATSYVTQNELEGKGIIPRQPRKKRKVG